MIDDQLVEAVAALAREAGQAIMPFFAADDIQTSTKVDARRSQVTEADLAAEKVILAGLARLTPDIPAVAEEEVSAGRTPDISGGRFWLVDPLDGTKEFLKKIPEFTVNIGIIEAVNRPWAWSTRRRPKTSTPATSNAAPGWNSRARSASPCRFAPSRP